ncbi:MAG TPA: hypothetical protein VGX25_19735 [Actinophytocola sp.]|uniref:hypothetical protein n=1 Tax=Actinophytocola sp. TaxID=1872138 RepID=UPI002DDD25ED|nr:hypothetical protein [Actinophytocola sp.]HEV2781621.1 hypothetical protein [Actinophytocola sp.]
MSEDTITRPITDPDGQHDQPVEPAGQHDKPLTAQQDGGEGQHDGTDGQHDSTDGSGEN